MAVQHVPWLTFPPFLYPGSQGGSEQEEQKGTMPLALPRVPSSVGLCCRAGRPLVSESNSVLALFLFLGL